MNYTHLKRGVQTAKRQPVSPARQMKGIVDRRPEFAAQRKLIDGIQNNSGVAQCKLKIGGVEVGFEKGKYYSAFDNTKKTFNDISEVFDFHKIERLGLKPEEGIFIDNLIKDNKLLKFSSAEYLLNKVHVTVSNWGEGQKISDDVVFIKKELNTNLTDDKIKELVNAGNRSAEVAKIKNTLEYYWYLIKQYRDIEGRESGEPFKSIKKQLFVLEVRLARALAIIDDGLLPKTKQAPGTYMCWFLSVFEGLRRSGLVYPIFEGLRGAGNKDLFKNAEGLGSWQKIFECQFMNPASEANKNHKTINEKTSRPKLDSSDLKIEANEAILITKKYDNEYEQDYEKWYAQNLVTWKKEIIREFHARMEESARKRLELCEKTCAKNKNLAICEKTWDEYEKSLSANIKTLCAEEEQRIKLLPKNKRKEYELGHRKIAQEEIPTRKSRTGDIMKPFFNEVLPQYEYSIEEFNMTGNVKKDWITKPPQGGVQMDEDCTRISFYTLDKIGEKPGEGHAVFYLGGAKGDIKVYNQAKKGEKNETVPVSGISFIQKHTFVLKGTVEAFLKKDIRLCFYLAALNRAKQIK